jgi:hypothetical protein
MVGELGEMMSPLDLRSAVLLGSVALVAGAPSAIAAPADSFVAPASPVVLTRELRRSLVDGKEIVTRRKYELRFLPEGEGWRVEGNLVDSQVEAPAELAMLAEIEKRRPDSGLFPLVLDSRGMIVAQQGAKDIAPGSEAKRVFDQSIERVGLAPAAKADASEMAGRIVATGRAAGGNWPTDLFRPQTQSGSQEQELALPGGKSGRVVVSVDAHRSSNGLMERFSRIVSTELDGTRRNSSETFTISR